MNRTLRLASLSIIAVLVLGSCADAPSDEHVINEPVRLQDIPGTDLERVILTAKAAQRLGIDTAPIEKNGNRLVVSSAAVLFDPEGRAWVYVNTKPLTYERREIKIDHEEGTKAILSDGPPEGTPVVTVGVPEIYGAESEVGAYH